jgi:hypothetical protein
MPRHASIEQNRKKHLISGVVIIVHSYSIHKPCRVLYHFLFCFPSYTLLIVINFYYGRHCSLRYQICNSNSTRYNYRVALTLIHTAYKPSVSFFWIGWRGLIKPYIFSTVAIGTSTTIGDFLCQYLEKNKKNKDNDTTLKTSSTFVPWWDRQRSLIMCTSAVFVITPWSFTLARMVERLFPG